MSFTNKIILLLFCIIGFNLSAQKRRDSKKANINLRQKLKDNSEIQTNPALNKIDIDLSQQKRIELAQGLNKLLSDEFTLYVKTLNYHWNVTDPNFFEFHKFFEKQYKALFKSIDKIAERIRALGFIAFGSQQEFLNSTQLKENKFNTIPDEQTMVKNLLSDHEAIIRSIREDLYPITVNLADFATNNLLANLIEKQEKTAWMLRSSVK